MDPYDIPRKVKTIRILPKYITQQQQRINKKIPKQNNE